MIRRDKRGNQPIHYNIRTKGQVQKPLKGIEMIISKEHQEGGWINNTQLDPKNKSEEEDPLDLWNQKKKEGFLGMNSPKNANWQLDDWSSAGDNWGYPPQEEATCGGNSRSRYCYPRLIKATGTKWNGLSQWLKEEILGEVSSKWSRDFQSNVKTCLKDNDKSPLDWGQVLDKVINQIQDDMVADVSENSRKLLRTPMEWYEVLNSSSSLNTPWNQSDVGRGLLIAVVCILTGLTSTRQHEKEKYPGRDELCDQVDRALMVNEGQWKRWLGGQAQDARAGRPDCGRPQGSRRCISGSMSLVLTIYRSLASLCPNCGPYSIARWVDEIQPKGISQGEQYCEVKKRVITCDKAQNRPWNPGDLRVVPEKDRRNISLDPRWAQSVDNTGINNPLRTANLKSSDQIRSSVHADQTPSKQQVGPLTTGPSPPVNSPDPQPQLPRNDVTSVINEKALDPPSMGQTTSSMSASVNGKQENSLSQKQPGAGSGGTGGQTSTLRSNLAKPDRKRDGSDILPETNKEQNSLTTPLVGLVGGVLAVILLGVASAYGIFRICRRKVGSKSKGDRINISVLPVPT
ncbi:hypothetical protein C922_04416 [Plasmodium inui San Antonio 1]|uniref:Uncharacterized protein n=1 Tax=Plasmodium inui San Antonio 1 TaxID=1237626 RepID=W7A0M1_9APIC|nr:hypothetical protein C922_04416 [Plasmodium inui San Antonio 1]EUD65130.1 hypothetical protein C922_04416 [Plasmodium inui San Antonio 1]